MLAQLRHQVRDMQQQVQQVTGTLAARHERQGAVAAERDGGTSSTYTELVRPSTGGISADDVGAIPLAGGLGSVEDVAEVYRVNPAPATAVRGRVDSHLACASFLVYESPIADRCVRW